MLGPRVLVVGAVVVIGALTLAAISSQTGPASGALDHATGTTTRVSGSVDHVATMDPTTTASTTTSTTTTTVPVRPVDHHNLTSKYGLGYGYVWDAHTVTVSAGVPFADDNVRAIFWRRQTPQPADQQACMSWNTVAGPRSGGDTQPGIALRIAPEGPGGTAVRAVTVTQDIWLTGIWLFNVHVWDTAKSQRPFKLVRTFDLSDVVGKVTNTDGVIDDTMAPTPWHICARATGNELTFIVWTRDEPKPSWNDPRHSFTTALPVGWDEPGFTGGYIGHLHAGQKAAFTLG